MGVVKHQPFTAAVITTRHLLLDLPLAFCDGCTDLVIGLDLLLPWAAITPLHKSRHRDAGRG